MVTKFIYITFGTICLASVVQFLIKLRWRRSFIKDIPKPPHSWLFGHLKLLGSLRGQIPPDLSPTSCWSLIAKRYNLPDIWVLDVWPIANPILVVSSPQIAASITQQTCLPKAPFVKPYLGKLVGEKSMFAAEGPEWKSLRALFNPGFSTSHLTSLAPDMSTHIRVFRDKLSDVAESGEVALLQDELTFLSLDIISMVVLDLDLGSQLGHSPIAYHFQAAVACTRPHIDWLGRFLMALPYRWHLRRLNRILSETIRQRYSTEGHSRKKSKVAVDLALQAYNEDKLGRAETGKPEHLDKDFLEIAVDNVKTLILGGHDTVSAAASYTFYFLCLDPDILERVRAEHDEVFSKDTEETIRILRSDPARLARLPLTNAVILETLRLRPPGLSFRAAPKDTYFEYDGKKIPAWNADIAIFHYGTHHHSVWNDPETFRPDRFLPPNEQPKDGWRPFEKGPRRCIGHELAMIEMRALLLLTVRDFDFEPAYEKDDPAIEGLGGQAYQMFQFSMKPAKLMPMRVKKRIR